MSTDEQVEKIRGWLTGRLPEDWFEGAPEVTVDREEITVVGQLAEPATAEGASDAEQAAAVVRPDQGVPRAHPRPAHRASPASSSTAPGARSPGACEVGDRRELFTTLSVPVMTRLRQPERQVLDTLVESGVARSRSDALAWCVRLVGSNAEQWLGDLRTAMEHVGKVRAEGPIP